MNPPEPPEAQPWAERIRGRERLKAMLDGSIWWDYKPDVERAAAATGVFTAAAIVIGGVNGSLQFRKRYQLDHALVKYDHAISYLRRSHEAAVHGFVRLGLRYGFMAFRTIGVFYGVQLLMQVYRNKTDFWNFWVSGTLAGGMMRLRHGRKMMLSTAVLASPLFAVGGLLYHVVINLIDGNGQLRRQRDEHRYNDYLFKVAAWKRIEVLDTMLNVRDPIFANFKPAPPPWVEEEHLETTHESGNDKEADTTDTKSDAPKDSSHDMQKER